jgi:protein gp37
MLLWNFQIGCTKVSTGCMNCYAEASYKRYGRNFTLVHKTGQFYAIKNKKTYPSGEDIWVCNSSDFFHNNADTWRAEIWEMIKTRPDLRFLIVTKRIERYLQSLPPDWNNGYSHVWICCTAEDQENADKRLPLFNDLPAKHKMIMVEPLFSKVDLSRYLSTGNYVQVVSGGECCMSRNCRLTRWNDVKYLYDQCKEYNVTFVFERTGTRWVGEGQTDQNKYMYIRGQGKQVEEAERVNLNYWSGNPDCFHLPIKYGGEGSCTRDRKR